MYIFWPPSLVFDLGLANLALTLDLVGWDFLPYVTKPIWRICSGIL